MNLCDVDAITPGGWYVGHASDSRVTMHTVVSISRQTPDVPLRLETTQVDIKAGRGSLEALSFLPCLEFVSSSHLRKIASLTMVQSIK